MDLSIRRRSLAGSFLIFAILFYLVSTILAADDKKPDSRATRISAAFIKADRDGNQRLTLKEFMANRGQSNATKRDFRLFDRNDDGFLSQEEFASVPSVVAIEDREPILDPIVALVDLMAAALDKSFNNWDQQPTTEIDSSQFIKALGDSFKNVEIQLDASLVDPNQDQKISRDEARRFIEIVMGVRRFDGKLLREPNGRVINYGKFWKIDSNHDDSLTRSEFVKSFSDADEATREFNMANTDGDDIISFEEWCHFLGRGIIDPIVDFQRLDSNFDRVVDSAELLAQSVKEYEKIVKTVFPGFDLDRDGKLSLSEYRLTMPANPVLDWQDLPSDLDGDGALSFTEFTFDKQLFPILRLAYFTRLDVNANNRLEPSEFPIQNKRPNEFFVMNEDGTGLQSLYLFDDHPIVGSPAVSPDGKWIAFDDAPVGQKGNERIYVMNIDGGSPRQICSGMMPTWSGDSRYLACTRREPMYGIWLIDTTNDDREHLKQTNWAQLSPDGKKLAFSEGSKLMTLDVESDAVTTAVNEESNRYASIFSNGTWSPDGKQFCVKCRKSDGTYDIATVSMVEKNGQVDFKVHYNCTAGMMTDFAWHPNGDRVVFSSICAERQGLKQLYEFNPDKIGSVKLVLGQDETRNNTDMCWTPDGKRLIFISGDFCED